MVLRGGHHYYVRSYQSCTSQACLAAEGMAELFSFQKWIMLSPETRLLRGAVPRYWRIGEPTMLTVRTVNSQDAQRSLKRTQHCQLPNGLQSPTTCSILGLSIDYPETLLNEASDRLRQCLWQVMPTENLVHLRRPWFLNAYSKL